MANRHNEPLSPQFLRDFLNQMKDAGDSRDVDRVLALCTEDIILDDLTEADVLKGRDEVREFFSRDLRRIARRLCIRGNRGAVPNSRWLGRRRPMAGCRNQAQLSLFWVGRRASPL